MIRKSFTVLALAFALIAPWQVCGRAETRTALVKSVIDGDTFKIEGGEKVRLIGVNSPEYSRRQVQPLGREASDFARGLLSGQRVRLESDVEPRDKYGRTLAYVYLEDGRFVNALLVEEGLARARDYPPNSARKSDLKAAEKHAKAAGKGLWGKSQLLAA